MFKLISSLLLLSLPVWANTCPPNQTVDGRACTVTCSQDRPGGDFAAEYTGSFQACINACAATAKCLTAQYHETNGYCYLKNTINFARSASGVDSVVCSASGSTTTKSTFASTTMATSKSTSSAPITSEPITSTTSSMSSGTTSADHVQPSTDVYHCQEGNIIVDPNSQKTFIFSCNAVYNGTFISQASAPDLIYCTDLCDSNPACVTASLYKPTMTCYLFSDITGYALGFNEFDSTLLLKALDPNSIPPPPGFPNVVKRNVPKIMGLQLDGLPLSGLQKASGLVTPKA